MPILAGPAVGGYLGIMAIKLLVDNTCRGKCKKNITTLFGCCCYLPIISLLIALGIAGGIIVGALAMALLTIPIIGI